MFVVLRVCLFLLRGYYRIYISTLSCCQGHSRGSYAYFIIYTHIPQFFHRYQLHNSFVKYIFTSLTFFSGIANFFYKEKVNDTEWPRTVLQHTHTHTYNDVWCIHHMIATVTGPVFITCQASLYITYCIRAM